MSLLWESKVKDEKSKRGKGKMYLKAGGQFEESNESLRKMWIPFLNKSSKMMKPDDYFISYYSQINQI